MPWKCKKGGIMSYMTMKMQIKSHLNFLVSNGLDVSELKINSGFIRCRSIGQDDSRGELSYKVTQSILNNGMIGLATWCRCQGGTVKTHKTYGCSENADISGILSMNGQIEEQGDFESV